jgi:hypothetical protein
MPERSLAARSLFGTEITCASEVRLQEGADFLVLALNTTPVPCIIGHPRLGEPRRYLTFP